MSKEPIISTVPQSTTNTVTINTNFRSIQDQFSNTLSLDGSTPNAMQADLDLNGNDILNAGSIFVDGEDLVATLEGYVQDAQDAADDSETSATASAASASTASTAASTATTQAGIATTKASEAAASAVTTTADRAQTGLDRDATAASAETALLAATTATTKAGEAAADRVQTGLDRTAAAASAGAAEDARDEAVEAAETLGSLATLEALADDWQVAVDETAANLAGSEAARDAAYVAANVYADKATGNADVADNVQFTVVEGDDLVRYKRVSSGVSTEVARTPTSAALTTVRNEVTTVQRIGYPESPVPSGSGTTGNNVFVFGVPAAKAGTLRRVVVHSPAGGTLYVSRWSKSGDVFTFIEEVAVTMVAGDQTIPLNITIGAGQYLGFYGNGVVSWATSTTADSGGWYVAGGHPTTSFTDAATTTTTRLLLGFDVETVDRVDELEAALALKAAQADVAAIEDDIYTTKTLNIGTTGVMVSGGADIDGSLYALEQACQQDGTVTEVRLFTVAAGTVRVMVYSKSGDTFTVEEEVNVSAAGGYEAFTISLPILAGQHVGVQSTNVGLKTGVSDTFGWYGGAGTSNFTDATPTRSSRILVGFSVEYTETSFNGASRPAAVDLPWENMLVIGMGQSLWEGSNGSVTTVVEYDSKGFPAYPAAPVSIADATVTNTQRATARGEWPGLGAAAAIRQALLRDNNLSHTDLKSTVVVANNAVGGSLITQINKGTAPFASAVAQAGALGGVTGESSGVLAVTFGQGESDSTALTDPATYLAALIQLAKDCDADLRAASGQSKRIPTIVYQMNATGRAIGLMHLQASLDSPLIYCAGPMYWLTYYDTLHINAASSRLVGALHGDVIKRVAIDSEDWEPLRPIDAKVLGNAITLTFNKSGLVLDSTTLPGQTNSGFVVKNSGGSVQTVSAVEVINGNQVRLTCVTTPGSGWTVEYGVAAVGRSDAFVGRMGNLRDNAGAERVFDSQPIHNWCVVFDWVL